MTHTYTHLQLFCGLGGLSRGFDEAKMDAYGLRGEFEHLGGLDSDPQTIEAYNRYTDSDHGHVADLFSRDQYRDFHGTEPSAEWREMTPADLLRITGGRCPDVVAMSPPCKGFSRLISNATADSAKYQALNALVVRGLMLVLEAFREDLPAVLLIENVRGITMRGERHLREVQALLKAHGYSLDGSAHCLGEWGGLAQRRPRWMLAARNTNKLSALLLQPPRQPLKTVGEVLSQLPPVGHPLGGRLHQPRKTTFRTALRLALIRAGYDWRDLKRLEVVDGVLKDYRIVPIGDYGRRGPLGVLCADQPAPTITSSTRSSSGRFAFPDSRAAANIPAAWQIVPVGDYGQHPGTLGVLRLDEVSPTVTAARSVGSGRMAIPDPRIPGTRFNHAYRVVALDDSIGTIKGDLGPGSQSIPDPRTTRDLSHNASGAWANGGPYGVLGWDESADVITASGSHDNAALSIADPRLPKPEAKGVWVTLSPDGTWHRPLTLLERAVLQDLIRPEDLHKPGALDWIEGAHDTRIAEWIGNAVPPAAGRTMAESILKCLLAEEAGIGFELTSQAIWAEEETRLSH